MTENWIWHILQLLSVLLFLAAGMEFGRWIEVYSLSHDAGKVLIADGKFNFHDFGRIVTLAGLGPLAYVYTLHFWLGILR